MSFNITVCPTNTGKKANKNKSHDFHALLQSSVIKNGTLTLFMLKARLLLFLFA